VTDTHSGSRNVVVRDSLVPDRASAEHDVTKANSVGSAPARPILIKRRTPRVANSSMTMARRARRSRSPRPHQPDKARTPHATTSSAKAPSNREHYETRALPAKRAADCCINNHGLRIMTSGLLRSLRTTLSVESVRSHVSRGVRNVASMKLIVSVSPLTRNRTNTSRL